MQNAVHLVKTCSRKQHHVPGLQSRLKGGGNKQTQKQVLSEENALKQPQPPNNQHPQFYPNFGLPKAYLNNHAPTTAS